MKSTKHKIVFGDFIKHDDNQILQFTLDGKEKELVVWKFDNVYTKEQLMRKVRRYYNGVKQNQ